MRLHSLIIWTVVFFILSDSNLSAQVLHRRRSAPKLPPPTQSESGNFQDGQQPITDRWHIQPPPYEINEPGHWWDPFHQNILKGDYPVLGQNTFFIFTGVSETLVEGRSLPTPSGASASGAGKFDFFGSGKQLAVLQYFKPSFELYHGNTAFKPRDWAIKLTPVFNINYLRASERGAVNIDVRRGKERFQTDFALQEAFAELHLANVSQYYDFISVRGGIQPFTSDFRGFIFSDTNFGARLFGNFANNVFQWNIAAFDMLEKSTNSELNTFARRRQQVAAANLYAQDFFGMKGWTNQFSLHWNHDDPSTHYDLNGVLVRPDPVGAATPHEIDAVYMGWTSEGRFGRFNLTHAFYFVVGEDDLNPIANRRTTLGAALAAAELSYDRDWYRLRSSFLFASGDSKPTNGNATGFDSIFDFQKFAGAENSFFNHQSIRIASVNLTQRNSFLPDLRSSEIEGQSNFVNPGLLLFNVGSDIEILPVLKAVVNVNYLRFVDTEPLELLLNQANIRNDIGWDYSAGLQYRPFLNNNVIFNLSGAVFQPLGGFKDILTSNLLFSTFLNTTLTF